MFNSKFKILAGLVLSLAFGTQALAAPSLSLDKRIGRIRKIMGRVDVSAGTPSVGAGTGFTVSDTAAGKVTVTLDRPGSTILHAAGWPINSTDTASHQGKVLSKTEASAVVFGIFAAGSGATTSVSQSPVVLSTSGGNTYTDAAVSASIQAIADHYKDALVTAINLQDGALADNVGFYFEITVQDR